MPSLDDVLPAPHFRERHARVIAARHFALEPTAGATRLVTETRVEATDARIPPCVRVYWLLIRAGSGLIRREMLRAVAARPSG